MKEKSSHTKAEINKIKNLAGKILERSSKGVKAKKGMVIVSEEVKGVKGTFYSQGGKINMSTSEILTVFCSILGKSYMDVAVDLVNLNRMTQEHQKRITKKSRKKK